jgi:hypothetical protein
MSALYGFSTFVRCALVVAFIAVCLVNARKLGSAGAFLMAGAAILDVATVLGFVLIGLVHGGESLYTVMSVFNVLFNLGSAVLFIVALVLWRKPPQTP